MADSTVIVAGDTTTFELNATKRGVIWDISGGTVLLKLKKPDGTVLTPIAASIIDGVNGVAQYTTPTTTLITGDWIRQWTVTKSGVTLSSRPIEFKVLELIG